MARTIENCAGEARGWGNQGEKPVRRNANLHFSNCISVWAELDDVEKIQ
jgi:hypothetical protein